MLRLRRRDLDAIAEVFAGTFATVKVTAGDFELDGYDEIDNLPDEVLTNLEIAGYEPGHVSLSLHPSNARLYCSNVADSTLRGAFERVDEHLRAARAWWGFLERPAVLPVVALVLVVFWARFSPDSSRLGAAWGVGLFLLYTLYFVWSARIGLRRHAVVSLADTPRGFLQRNRDQLLVNLITLVVGAAIGSLVTLWVGG